MNLWNVSYFVQVLVMRLMHSFIDKAKIWQLIFFVNLKDNQSSYFGFREGAGSENLGGQVVIQRAIPLLKWKKKSISLEIVRTNYTQLVFKSNGGLQFVKKTMFLLILMDLGYIDWSCLDCCPPCVSSF